MTAPSQLQVASLDNQDLGEHVVAAKKRWGTPYVITSTLMADTSTGHAQGCDGSAAACGATTS